MTYAAESLRKKKLSRRYPPISAVLFRPRKGLTFTIIKVTKHIKAMTFCERHATAYSYLRQKVQVYLPILRDPSNQIIEPQPAIICVLSVDKAIAYLNLVKLV